MQEKPLNQNSDNEVELGNFTGRVSNFFDSFLGGIFNFIQLLYRNKWITLSLILIGVALGFLQTFLSKPKFKNEVIVAANFNSNEYLYSKVKNFGAMKAAASNPNGAMAGFMGMGMAGNMMGSMANFMQGAENNQPTMQNQQVNVGAGGWKCECGTENTGKFCQNCGKPQPAPSGWTGTSAPGGA